MPERQGGTVGQIWILQAGEVRVCSRAPSRRWIGCRRPPHGSPSLVLTMRLRSATFFLLVSTVLAACGSAEDSAGSAESGGGGSLGSEVAKAIFGRVGDERTELSERTDRLREGISREEVVALLGPADFADLPGEDGRFSLVGTEGNLTLFWRNGACEPAASSFGEGGGLVLWQSGLSCGGVTSHYVRLLADQACSREDRAALCR